MIRLRTFHSNRQNAELRRIKLKIRNKATSVAIKTIHSGTTFKVHSIHPVCRYHLCCVYLINNVLPKGLHISRTGENAGHTHYSYIGSLHRSFSYQLFPAMISTWLSLPYFSSLTKVSIPSCSGIKDIPLRSYSFSSVEDTIPAPFHGPQLMAITLPFIFFFSAQAYLSITLFAAA